MSALPAPPINTLPLSLLSYLGIKNGGRNPDFLAGQLLPTLDIGFFYDAGLRKASISALFAVAAVGPNASTLAVPQGEAWIVEQVIAYPGAALGAGVTLNYSIQITDGAATPTNVCIGSATGAYTAGQWPVATLDGPVILLPGSTFTLFAHQLAAGPVNCQIHFTGAKLQI